MVEYENFNLKEFNGYKINSSCEYAIFPESEEEIREIVDEFKDIIIIGSGHNVILERPYYKKRFLILNKTLNEIFIDTEKQIISSECGAFLPELSINAMEHNLGGLEFAYDIPSSVGGAAYMNAGTKEGEIKNIIEKVRYLDLNTLKFEEITKDEIKWDYRNSPFQENNSIIIKVWFKLINKNKELIWNQMQLSKERRWRNQPREYPSCGSVFKRPKGMYVGPMIRELGLAGLQIGGAKISEKHSGFIVNYNNATGKDILSLVSLIQEEVSKAYGISLELEQKII